MQARGWIDREDGVEPVFGASDFAGFDPDGTEHERHTGRVNQLLDPSASVSIAFDGPGGGRLGPENHVRFGGAGGEREGIEDVENGWALRRIPFHCLRNVGLNKCEAAKRHGVAWTVECLLNLSSYADQQ